MYRKLTGRMASAADTRAGPASLVVRIYLRFDSFSLSANKEDGKKTSAVYNPFPPPDAFSRVVEHVSFFRPRIDTKRAISDTE